MFRRTAHFHALCVPVSLCWVVLTSQFVAAEQTHPPATETASQPSTATHKELFFLITDYLPRALYEGEALTACFRVENTTASDAEVTLRAEHFDPAGKKLYARQTPCCAKAHGYSEIRMPLTTADTARVTFTLVTAHGETNGPAVLIFRNQQPWPVTEVRGGRLVEKDTGAVLLPVAQRVKRERERKFAPVKWALGSAELDPIEAVRTALLLLPGAWAEARSLGERAEMEPHFGSLCPEKSKRTVALGPYPLQGPPPILLATGEILRAVSSAAVAAPERVVIVLPPEDLEAATEPRLYRIVLDVLLARLQVAGVRHVLLLPPVKWGVPEARIKALADEVRAAAQDHKARALDVTPWLEERYWRADPSLAGVFIRCPNGEGRKWMGQMLEELLP